MALIKKPWTFRLGTKADPDQANANFDVLYTEVNGKLDDNNIAPITASQEDNTAGSAILTGKLSQIASRLFTLARSMKGTTNVWDAPPITLKDVKAKIDAFDPDNDNKIEISESADTVNGKRLMKDRFVISGNIVNHSFYVSPGIYSIFYIIPVWIPKGKKLYLVYTRFDLIREEMRMAIQINTDYKWTSDKCSSDSELKVELATGNDVSVSLKVCGTAAHGSSDFQDCCGYMLEFFIE